MERVVDRSELLSEPNTPPSSPDIRDIKTLGNFEFVHHQDALENGEENADEEMDFCLFAPDANADATVAKIRLQTPPLTEGEPGFLSSRPQDHYFTQFLNKEEKENFQRAALSGEEVMSRSHSLQPGSAYEWKVLHIQATKHQQLLLSTSANVTPLPIENQLESKRKRPGKKYRLRIRAKLSAAKAEQEGLRKAADLKEAAEKEKRMRRNREKKAKKKQRDKAKKAAGGAVADDGADESSSE